MTRQNWRQIATRRVMSEPELRPYRRLLIDYDWPNIDEHLVWVASASIVSLVRWAVDIETEEARAQMAQ